MSLSYIRKTYGVPAFRGQRVKYVRENHSDKVGRITSAKGPYLRIFFDGHIKTYPGVFHPTWNLEYLT